MKNPMSLHMDEYVNTEESINYLKLRLEVKRALFSILTESKGGEINMQWFIDSCRERVNEDLTDEIVLECIMEYDGLLWSAQCSTKPYLEV